MSWTVLLIVVLGAALARLNQETTHEPAAGDADSGAIIDVPDDLWAAFAATGDIDGRRTTVGGMTPGESGFVAHDAAARDEDGTLWLDAAAIVHPTLTPDRVALRRNADGYMLQRRRGAAPSRADDRRTRARVQVLELFD